jgi:non-ribosomal peptide synthetase component F
VAGDSLSAPPLVRAERNGRLPLSFAQQRLWFIDQLEPGNPAYNSPRVVRLEGELDYAALVAALSEIVRRHEVLRTSFPTVEGEPIQLVHEAHALHVPVVDVEHLAGSGAQATTRDASVRERAARAVVEREAARSFDLSAGPVVRALLVRLNEREHVLVVVLHHIVSDGWSAGVLVREFGLLYEAFRQGRPSPLAELPVQYADYAVWQRDWLQGEVLERQLAYWREQLRDLEALELPTDYARQATGGTSRGAVVRFELNSEVTAQLREVSRKEGVTLFMLLTAAFQLLLSRYSGQRDVAVGTAIANRNRLETEPLVGFFINQLVLRARLDECRTTRDLLAQVRETVLGAYAHQDLPFERIVEEVAPDRELSRSPLFQHAIELQSLRGESDEPWQLAETKLSSVTLEGATTKLDLDVVLYERDSISGYAYYDANLFSEATIDFLVRGFESILNEFVRDVDAELSGISPVSGGGLESHAAQLATSLELLEV